MTLQLHHLHTDGPKPLYKKITADEYERLVEENRRMREALRRHGITLFKMEENDG